jgi:ribosome-associated translation inhibitor RaiA
MTPSLEAFIQEKIGSLEKLLSRFDKEKTVDVWIEVGRTTRHHHKGGVYEAKADVVLPHRVLRAVHVDSDVRVAVDRVRDALRLEIKKFKDEAVAQRRKG